MAESVPIAAFEGGALTVYAADEKTREVSLALPLNRLLTALVRVPAEHRDAPEALAQNLLKEKSPYPDEALTVGLEFLHEGPEGALAFAAALPESAADDIGEALDAAKLNPVAIDALALGVLRERKAEIGLSAARRLVLIREMDDIAAFVLDGELPVAVRAIADGADLKRETMLCLLEAEDFGGAGELAEIVTIGDVPAEGLEAFAPVRALPAQASAEDKAPEGLAARAKEPGTLNALPESWRQMLEETRFKAKLVRFVAVALGVWVLAMGVLFGVPFAYGFMTDHQKALSREHARRYNEVREMREKVRLVQKYSDHARGALEILKAVSDRLPEGMELGNWNFKREDGVRFAGEAADAASVYQFKDALLAVQLGEGEDAEKVFADVILTGPSAAKGGRQRFDIDCRYETEEDR